MSGFLNEDHSSENEYEAAENDRLKKLTIKDNKTRWLLMGQVENILLDNDFSIFGGYVRDKIIHDYNANKFYKHESTLCLHPKDLEKEYNNPNFLPEFVDRLLIPNDIDCFIQKFDKAKLQKKLKNHNLIIQSIIKKKANLYFEFDNNDRVSLSKIKIGFDINPVLSKLISKELYNMSRYNISIDILHIEDYIETNIYRAITSRIDFECNSLIITPEREYKLCYSLLDRKKNMNIPINNHNKITSIIDDIVNKKAVLIDYEHVPMYRIENILKKKWKINIENQLLLVEATKNLEDRCLICHNEFVKNEYHIKHTECQARYHSKCYYDMINSIEYKYECPLCKVEDTLTPTKLNKFLINFSISFDINVETNTANFAVLEDSIDETLDERIINTANRITYRRPRNL